MCAAPANKMRRNEISENAVSCPEIGMVVDVVGDEPVSGVNSLITGN